MWRQPEPGGVRRRVSPLHRLYPNPDRRHLWGLSVHYYTSGSPTKFAAGDALNFNSDEYYDLLTRGSIMERVVTDHWHAMGTVEGQPKVKLVVDEWGAWYGKGTALGPEYNLSQQSTMRDALLTGITFDIFQRHADKVAVAAVEQSVNCIHSLMLAQGDRAALRQPSMYSKCICRIAELRRFAQSLQRRPFL